MRGYVYALFTLIITVMPRGPVISVTSLLSSFRLCRPVRYPTSGLEVPPGRQLVPSNVRLIDPSLLSGASCLVASLSPEVVILTGECRNIGIVYVCVWG